MGRIFGRGKMRKKCHKYIKIHFFKSWKLYVRTIISIFPSNVGDEEKKSKT